MFHLAVPLPEEGNNMPLSFLRLTQALASVGV